ncbi:uncharacterized protein LOC110447403 [Mizuhopecten yessoensis]|uniref:Transcobalamin-1 n=1 Tax=Mizuhopecten yessoensis TaxID=6573 RepID=A0A210QVJ9_MIZYE|nr:uncharacterized protein LOC110447403 [Mizuhopecten yessoensis]OWF52716.1 Transcobalamin-1 [Mizuhopecten yessoensis]
MDVLNTVLIVLHVCYGVMSLSNRAQTSSGRTIASYNHRHSLSLDLAAIQTGSYHLLRARTGWQWAPRTNAEAIIGLTLANNRWYHKDNAATYISIQAMEMELLAQLSVDKKLKDIRWSRGKLAQYVTALQLTCHNPSKFFRHNLLRLLKGHLQMSETFFRANRFALSWIVISLCNNKKAVGNTTLEIINDSPGEYKFGVDEASMILMATVCLNETAAKSAAEKFIVEEMRMNMTQYNEFTIGLAVQALTAAKAVQVDDIISTARYDLGKAILGSNLLEYPGAASNVLPALAKKSYLDASKVYCPKKVNKIIKVKSKASITVEIRVIDDLIGNTSTSWNVISRKGSTLYSTMKDLQKQSATFSFKSERTSFGKSITAINGVAKDIDKNISWRLEDGSGTALAKGVSETVPKDGDVCTFRLTKA